MKIALCTASIGEIDEVIKPVEQSVEYDYFCYTDSNLPFPLPNMDNRTKSKYIKIMTHRFLPDYDIYIWIDGRVEVIDKDFIKKIITPIINNESEYVNILHTHRKSVYEEMDYIIGHIKSGQGYLTSRYAHQKMEKEMEFYRSNGMPEDYPLYSSGIFARKNNRLHVFFEEWFLRSMEFSNFDQSMYSYVAYKLGIQIKSFSWDEVEGDGKWFKLNKHK